MRSEQASEDVQSGSRNSSGTVQLGQRIHIGSSYGPPFSLNFASHEGQLPWMVPILVWMRKTYRATPLPNRGMNHVLIKCTAGMMMVDTPMMTEPMNMGRERESRSARL